MAPGPAISGSASGKTAMLWMWSRVIATSLVFSLRSLRRSKIISKAIQKSSRPPAMRKAPMEMPSNDSTPAPVSANTARMQKAISEPRSATCLRCGRVMPTVSPRKIGARPGGSMVTSRVVMALTRRSIVSIRPFPSPFVGHFPWPCARIVRRARPAREGWSRQRGCNVMKMNKLADFTRKSLFKTLGKIGAAGAGRL